MISKQLNPQGQFETWSKSRLEELHSDQTSMEVGTRLLYQDVSILVWEIRLQPGERLPFHKHTTDYTWVALTPGTAISHYGSGEVVGITYEQGDVHYYHHSKEGDFVHDLENIGKGMLIFGTIEYKLNFGQEKGQ